MVVWLLCSLGVLVICSCVFSRINCSVCVCCCSRNSSGMFVCVFYRSNCILIVCVSIGCEVVCLCVLLWD